ncbi:helix-turn-helix transcriptional regulator [Dactylosporangium sp. NPDC050688]|uniref:helix-turn-helix domain-containing protein n=1 Tax=Dactylosporangium sp. NPDC050688 TaxID=3157217 RepID=UPI0033D59BF9
MRPLDASPSTAVEPCRVRRRFMASGVVSPDSRQTVGVLAFGNLLRQARQRQQWSQRELGAATFFSREYVAMVERGLRTPSATFVERAGAALDVDRELWAPFAQLQGIRHRTARQRAEGRRIRRRSRITVAAGRLRAAVATLQTPDRWAAFDELHHTLREETDPVDAAAELAELEQQCADLVGDGRVDPTWDDVATRAALGLADAIAMLQRPLCADQCDRLKAVARRFAVLSADALLMLGEVERAVQWLGLMDPTDRRGAVVQPAAVPMGSPEVIPPARPGIHASSRSQRDGSVETPLSTRWTARRSTRGGHPTTGDLWLGARHTSRRRLSHGRAPPGHDRGTERTSNREPSGSSTNVA